MYRPDIYIALMIFTISFMSGCSSYNGIYIGYNGDLLPQEQVSFVNIINVKDKLKKIDDTQFNIDLIRYNHSGIPGSDVMALLPGSHELTFQHKPYNVDWKGDYIRYNRTGSIKLKIKLEPGYAYIIKNRNHNYKTFRALNNDVIWEPILEKLGPIDGLDTDRWNPDISSITDALRRYNSLSAEWESTDNQQ